MLGVLEIMNILMILIILNSSELIYDSEQSGVSKKAKCMGSMVCIPSRILPLSDSPHTAVVARGAHLFVFIDFPPFKFPIYALNSTE